MKRGFFLLPALLLLLCCSGPAAIETPTEFPDPDPGLPAEPSEPASDAVRNMGVGLSLCGTFEEPEGYKGTPSRDDPKSFETWNGREVTLPITMTATAEAGFRTMRIPVTWNLHMDNTMAVIDKVWLDRIEEVVNYALDAGMYCIINVHHDAGGTSNAWLFADYAKYADLSARFKNIWKQIAIRFRDYDDKLIFEGYNEIIDAQKTWFVPKDMSSFTAANQLNQDFVNTVRATGGRNATRNLAVATFSAGTREKTLQNFVMPKDKVEGHLIAKFHSYVPVAVCTAKTEHRNYVDSDEPEIEAVFELVQKYLLDKGYPCMLGEYGIYPRKSEPGNSEMRGHHAYVYTTKALNRGIAPIYWYNPMDWTLRKWGKWSYPEVKDSLVKAYDDFLAKKARVLE